MPVEYRLIQYEPAFAGCFVVFVRQLHGMYRSRSVINNFGKL
jgi:hypothetical protein